MIKMLNDQGIILVNKDSGKTSAAVVAQLRKLLGMKRVGHCGTLDPFATGVLPIVFGRATAAVPYMINYDKKYRCQIQLGARTDTMDLEGEVVARAPEDFDLSRLADRSYLEAVINSFQGEIQQQAPLYSAVKVDGKALYKYARQEEEVERPWRSVTVYELELLDLYYVETEKFPRLDVKFFTSKGTYIRSLADAIGEKLGCYAYAAELVRTDSGPFGLDQTVKVDDLFARFNELGRSSKAFLDAITTENKVLPTLAAFDAYPTYALQRHEALQLAHGQKITLSDQETSHATITFTYNNILIAVGSVEQGAVVVKRVFVDSAAKFLHEGSVDEDI